MTISTTKRMPFMYVEFDPSRAFQGASVLAYKALLIGQPTSTGTKYSAGVDATGPYRVTSADQVGQYAGAGSQLHRMAVAWFNNAKTVETHIVLLKDNGTTKAAGSMVFTGPSTAAGTVYAYINGKQLQIAVASGDSATIVGDALVAAITAETSLPVTAVNTTGSVAITSKNAGTIGNSIDIRINYNDGETLPAGIACAVTALTGGATDPDITDAIALIGDEWYNVIVGALVDATNLGIIEIELADRFGADRMIDGVYIAGKRGTLSALTSFGAGRNSPHVSIIHNGGVTGVGGPSWSIELAAAAAGQAAKEGQTDPARPLQSLELVGILPPAITERFSNTESNSLLWDGVSAWYVDEGGKCRIGRMITMYQKNDAGADDIAYLDLETMLTLMYLRYDFRTKILTKYPRAKLANDGVQVAPNQQIITPKIGKAEAISIFRQWEFAGLVENADQFKNDLQCYRSEVDPNRLEWVLPPDLINQFRIGAATIQFLLQSPSV